MKDVKQNLKKTIDKEDSLSPEFKQELMTNIGF